MSPTNTYTHAHSVCWPLNEHPMFHVPRPPRRPAREVLSPCFPHLHQLLSGCRTRTSLPQSYQTGPSCCPPPWVSGMKTGRGSRRRLRSTGGWRPQQTCVRWEGLVHCERLSSCDDGLRQGEVRRRCLQHASPPAKSLDTRVTLWKVSIARAQQSDEGAMCVAVVAVACVSAACGVV